MTRSADEAGEAVAIGFPLIIEMLSRGAAGIRDVEAWRRRGALVLDVERRSPPSTRRTRLEAACRGIDATLAALRELHQIAAAGKTSTALLRRSRPH